MSWFDRGSLSTFAKTALSSAQKSIDRVLDIQDEEGGENPTADPAAGGGTSTTQSVPVAVQQSAAKKSTPPVETREKKTTVNKPIKETEGMKIDSIIKFTLTF